MTFAELCRTLPNGLHDAALRAVRIDYDRREAVLDVHVDIGGPDLNPPETVQARPLALRRTRISRHRAAGPVVSPVRAGVDRRGQPPTSPVALPALPDGTFLCWIFVNGWNSFIRIAAASVEFEPIER